MLAVLLITAVAAVFSACGGDDSTSASGDGTSSSQSAQQTPDSESSANAGDSNDGANANNGGGGASSGSEDGEDTGGGGKGADSGGSGGGGANGDGGSNSDEASAEFRTPGGDNSVQEYGSEADDAEREAASAAVEGFMTARAASDWKGVCTWLSASVAESIEKVAAAGGGCVATFEAISERLPPEALVNTMTGPITSLRAEGAQGFALYHGKEGKDYTVPMSREAGGWKVNALEPTPLS